MITKQSLTVIARDALKNPGLTFDANMSNTSEWDSVGQLSMLIALDAFTNGRTAKITAIASCKSLAEIYSVLGENNLAGKD